MKMQFSSPFNFMMMLIMLISTIMIVSSTNWTMMWMSMELNMLSFIPILVQDNKTDQMEATIKYFLIQALGSTILIMSAMVMLTSLLPTTVSSFTIMLSLLIKLGISPFHHWYVSMMSSISWSSCFLLSTWQKVGPLVVLSFTTDFPNLSASLAALNSIMGGYMGMNQSSLRLIMAYSSISHLGWVMALISAQAPIASITYFIMYTILSLPLFSVFFIMDMKTTLSINNSCPMNWFIPPSLLSLSGIPPLSGFIPKWMALNYLSDHPTLILLILVGSIMSAYFYLNITFSFFTNIWKSSAPPKLPPEIPPCHPMICALPFKVMSFFAQFFLFLAPTVILIY